MSKHNIIDRWEASSKRTFAAWEASNKSWEKFSLQSFWWGFTIGACTGALVLLVLLWALGAVR